MPLISGQLCRRAVLLQLANIILMLARFSPIASVDSYESLIHAPNTQASAGNTVTEIFHSSKQLASTK